jgi:hypothetical protein
MTITRDEFTAAMRKAVELRGADYVYPKDQPGFTKAQVSAFRSDPACLYVNAVTGEPACLIGLALSIIDPALLEPVGTAIAPACRVLPELGVDYDAAYAADAAQQEQDKGETWGECLMIYEEKLGI